MLNEDIKFPPARLAGTDGLLAIGGDLSAERLLEAYRNGIFPWFSGGAPIMWWSPDPRMIMKPEEFIVRKSLRNILNRAKFEVRVDQNFLAVMKNCAEVPREGQHDTWITDEMIKSYNKLFELGFAHSFETYYKKELIGGLYGISIGKAFFGESMFYKERDASKVALYYLSELMKKWKFHFIDVQQETDHLKSLGAYPLQREKFLNLLNKALKFPSRIGKWSLDNE